MVSVYHCSAFLVLNLQHGGAAKRFTIFVSREADKTMEVDGGMGQTLYGFVVCCHNSHHCWYYFCRLDVGRSSIFAIFPCDAECYPEGCAAPGEVPCQCNTRGFLSKLKKTPPQIKINVTSKSPVGDISVVTLIRTDTTLDHSQKAEKVCWMSTSYVYVQFAEKMLVRVLQLTTSVCERLAQWRVRVQRDMLEQANSDYREISGVTPATNK